MDYFELSSYLSLFAQFSWMEWIVFSLASNIVLYLFSIGLYLLIDRACRKDKIQLQDHPVHRSDFLLSFLTVLCNSAVMLLGACLWKADWIELNNEHRPFQLASEIFAILLLMDLLMYIFHYTAHLPRIYRLLHAKHHQHTSTNFLSLFVLHPFETLGFGLLMIFLFMCYNFSLISITAYLLINLVWGTIGHLNKEFFPRRSALLFIGTTGFHNQHHLDESKNFGFYTSIWDRLFGTYKSI